MIPVPEPPTGGGSRTSWRWRMFWLGLVVVVAFGIGRFHYFLPDTPRFHRIGHDAAWFYGFQAQLARGEMTPTTAYQQARMEIRSPMDRLWSALVVRGAQGFGADLWRFNLWVTAMVFLAAAVTTYVLGLALFRSPPIAAAFTLLAIQTDIFSWLDYPVFVPKMLGFVLFPLLLACMVKSVADLRFLRWFILVLLVMAIVYGPSVLYVAPVIVLVEAVVVAQAAKAARRSPLVPLVELGLGALASLGLLWALGGQTRGAQAPAQHIADYFYPLSGLTWRWLRQDYLPEMVLVVFAIPLAFMVRRRGDRRDLWLLLATYLGLMGVGMAMLLVTPYIDKVRMLWLWRTCYYSHLPAIALVMLVAITAIRLDRESRRLRYAGIALLFAGVVVLVGKASNDMHTWKGALQTHRHISPHREENFDLTLAPLVAFAKGEPPASVFLMPPVKEQGDKLAHLFEAESGRAVVLSAFEKYLMIVSGPLTASYHQGLRELDRIHDIRDPSRFLPELRALARSVGATHLLIRKSRLGDLPADARILWQDGHWLVLPSGG